MENRLIRAISPLTSPAQFDDLTENIEKNGLIDPIMLHERDEPVGLGVNGGHLRRVIRRAM
jgi:hypothetical protein